MWYSFLLYLASFVYYLPHMIWCDNGHKVLAHLTKGMITVKCNELHMLY